MPSERLSSADVRRRSTRRPPLILGSSLWLPTLLVTLLSIVPNARTQELSIDHICMSDSDCSVGQHCALPSLTSPSSGPGHCVSIDSPFATEASSDLPSGHWDSSRFAVDHESSAFESNGASTVAFDNSSANHSSSTVSESIGDRDVVRSTESPEPHRTTLTGSTAVPDQSGHEDGVTRRTSEASRSADVPFVALESASNVSPVIADPLSASASTLTSSLNSTTANLTTETTATATPASTSLPTSTPLPAAFSCKDRPCRNRGRCSNVQNGTFTCDCQSGYFGDRCEFTHCGRCTHGKCLLEEDEDPELGRQQPTYRCYCVSGFTGFACDEDVNECLRRPCVNGTCVNKPGSYQCDCIRGFDGKHCDNEIDECAHNPCVNNATCSDLIGDYRCECRPGFDGKNCERNIDECADRPCRNKGQSKSSYLLHFGASKVSRSV
jgi:hypothetical protein